MARKLFPHLLAGLGAIASMGCTATSEEEEAAQKPKFVLHVFNPFEIEGIPPEASGHQPYFHGESNAFGLTKMNAEGSCGWYELSFDAPPGAFRFYGSDWNGPQWGAQGLGSRVNFNQDGLFETSLDVYAAPDVQSGFTDFHTTLPFECDPGPRTVAENPFSRGQLPSNANVAHVDPLYQVWLSNFYEEEGSLARIKFDDPSQTVSEGIGYGMLIFVYANDPEARQRFDKLLAYRDTFVSSSGLMHWKVSGFTSVIGSGGATDADLDIATALILANRKWNEPSYLAAAQTLIDAIRMHAFTPSGYLKSGDLWQDDQSLNPSYFSFPAFELFSEVDTSGAAFWEAAIVQHYALIQNGQNPSTGLIANWTSSSGAPQAPPPTTPYPGWDLFGFDAVRVPWRTAWAALWYGAQSEHTPAAQITTDFCAFAETSTDGDPASLNAEYTLTGAAVGVDAGPGAIGAFAAACMLDTARTSYLGAAYNLMRTKTADYDITYYQTTLQVLEALLLTGAMRPL